jgi:hypothetical protein
LISWKENVMAWDPEVAGCFGETDKAFAVHPLDEGRPFTWLTILRKQEATLNDAERQVRDYLVSEECAEKHIQEQLKRLHTRFSPWLPKA